MKVTLCMILAAAVVVSATAADEAKPNAPAPAAAVPAGAAPANASKPATLSPEQQAQYTRLTSEELSLNAELKLLTELTEEHARRAGDSSRTTSSERGQWETDLTQELRTRRALVLNQLNALTEQRLAFERAHGPVSTPGLGVLGGARALSADEFTYVTRLDERMLKVRQELAVTDEAVKVFFMELQTNNAPEAVQRVSAMVEENTRLARQWEREDSELELKKLEFQALRKP